MDVIFTIENNSSLVIVVTSGEGYEVIKMDGFYGSYGYGTVEGFYLTLKAAIYAAKIQVGIWE